MFSDYDPMMDNVWDDDETTPVIDRNPPPPKQEHVTKGEFLRSPDSQWDCYICARPTNISLSMGTYVLRIHPICAVQHKIVELPNK